MTATNIKLEELFDNHVLKYSWSEDYKTPDYFRAWAENLYNFNECVLNLKIERMELIDLFEAKFLIDNYKELIQDILECFAETGDYEYFEVFIDIYEVVKSLDVNETDILEEYTSYVFIDFVFKNKNKNFLELLKVEATPALNFMGKRITIEEYYDLNFEVVKMNRYLTTKLLYNKPAKLSAALGLKSHEESFCELVEIFKSNEQEE